MSADAEDLTLGSQAGAYIGSANALEALGTRAAMMGASCAISWGAYESFKKVYDRVWPTPK